MVLDIIIVCLALISGFVGIKKGMIAIVTKIVGFVLATIFAFMFYKSLATYLTQNYEFPAQINESIKNIIASEENNTTQEDEYISLSNIIERFKLDGKLDLEEEQKSLEEEKTLSDVVAEKITMYIMNIVAFLIIFLTIIIVAAVLSLILGVIFSLPLLNSANKLGGFAAEVILFVIKLWVVLAVISILSPMSFMTWAVNLIENSVIIKFLYNHNLLIQLIYRIKI